MIDWIQGKIAAAKKIYADVFWFITEVKRLRADISEALNYLSNLKQIWEEVKKVEQALIELLAAARAISASINTAVDKLGQVGSTPEQIQAVRETTTILTDANTKLAAALTPPPPVV